MWEAALAILSKLFPTRATEPRVDFESVTAMWERLSERLTARITELEGQVTGLETKLDECRKRYEDAHKLRIDLSLRFGELESELAQLRRDKK